MSRGIDGLERPLLTLEDVDKLMQLEAIPSNEPGLREEVVFADLKGKTDEELKEIIRHQLAALTEIRGDGPECSSNTAKLGPM